jgi:hypothetical protein
MTNGICDPACSGQELKYLFINLSKKLVRKFGEDWYAELETVAEEYKNNSK